MCLARNISGSSDALRVKSTSKKKQQQQPSARGTALLQLLRRLCESYTAAEAGVSDTTDTSATASSCIIPPSRSSSVRSSSANESSPTMSQQQLQQQLQALLQDQQPKQRRRLSMEANSVGPVGQAAAVRRLSEPSLSWVDHHSLKQQELTSTPIPSQLHIAKQQQQQQAALQLQEAARQAAVMGEQQAWQRRVEQQQQALLLRGVPSPPQQQQPLPPPPSSLPPELLRQCGAQAPLPDLADVSLQVKRLLDFAQQHMSPALAFQLRHHFLGQVRQAAREARAAGTPFSVALALQQMLPGLQQDVKIAISQGPPPNLASPAGAAAAGRLAGAITAGVSSATLASPVPAALPPWEVSAPPASGHSLKMVTVTGSSDTMLAAAAVETALCAAAAEARLACQPPGSAAAAAAGRSGHLAPTHAAGAAMGGIDVDRVLQAELASVLSARTMR